MFSFPTGRDYSGFFLQSQFHAFAKARIDGLMRLEKETALRNLVSRPQGFTRGIRTVTVKTRPPNSAFGLSIATRRTPMRRHPATIIRRSARGGPEIR
jgi:hypothetical protein